MRRPPDGTARRWCLGILLGVAACAPPPKQAETADDPPADPGIATYLRGAPPREPVVAPTRPDVYSSIAIDYGAIPVLPALVAIADRSDSFRYFQVERRCALLTTEGVVGTATLGTQRLDVLPVEPGPGPDGCLFGPERVQGFVEGLRVATWEDGAVDFVRIAVASERSVVTEKKRTEARARALVPRLLYALRAPLAGAKEGSGEKLVLLGPRTSWAVAAEPGLLPAPHRTEAFSKVAIDVRRGATASAALTFEWRAVSAMLALRDPSTAFEVDPRLQGSVSVGIELVWPESDDFPSLLVLVGSEHPYDGPMPARRGALDEEDFVFERSR